ncbi:MAG: hypothetical protein A2X45_12250 [Lentisphaerae bacterium GWF2_50_93]|nr:MAG: hypothetical protein A2X45_12250 [Lentisphaerae bacterium GWF2_50_93]
MGKAVFPCPELVEGKPPINRRVETRHTCAEVDKYFSAIDSWFKGAARDLPTDNIFLERLSPFQKNILCELRSKVPAGKTISYGGLAKLAGYQGAARAVGTVMSSNPFPLVFPCHRVIRSDGSVGCFQGGEKGIPLKKALLENEGVIK